MSTLYNVLTRQRRRKEMSEGTYSPTGPGMSGEGIIKRQSGGAVTPQASPGAGADPYGIDQLINEINSMNEKIRKGGKEKNDPNVNSYMSTLSNVLARQRRRKEMDEGKYSPGNKNTMPLSTSLAVPYRTGGSVEDWDSTGDVHPALLADREHVVNAEAASYPGVRRILDDLNNVGLMMRRAA